MAELNTGIAAILRRHEARLLADWMSELTKGGRSGAIDKAELGNLTELLRTIAPSVEEVVDFDGERSSQNAAFVHRVAKQNVLRTLRRIRDESSVLRKLEEDLKIAIVGGMYDMLTGEVTFLDKEKPST